MIAEDLTLDREKYSEAKLLANFLKASPAYFTATPGNGSNGSFVDISSIEVTPLFGNDSATNFYVLRHALYNSTNLTRYKLTVTTSEGQVTIPQLNVFDSSLSLHGRDSKIHVTDYEVGNITLIYSTADIFTWEAYRIGTVLVLYGGANETHEFALPAPFGKSFSVTGDRVHAQNKSDDSIIVQWQVTSMQQTISFSGLTVYLLWRNDAYNWWTLELPAPPPINNYTSLTKTRLIAKAGYLLRSASVVSNAVYLSGDVNSTTVIEVIGGAPSSSAAIFFNGEQRNTSTTAWGTLSAPVLYDPPTISVPDLSSLTWKYIDSLPEIQSSYSDALWTTCNLTSSNNPRNLTTPTSLYAGDYGYHAGSLLYRGHFTAATDNGSTAPSLFLETEGGYAFGHSLWINDSFVGSWRGIDADETCNVTYPLPNLTTGETYVLTLLIDHMGLTENGKPGADTMKEPRGILRYSLSGYEPSAIRWKTTGNLGGEHYVDKVRGPLNEGALYAERQGFHLPSPPDFGWSVSSPFEGVSGPGVAFYTTSFTLDVPEGYDVPLAFIFTNTSSPTANSSTTTTTTASPSNYRAQLFVNGYQFGKYVNNIGPQTRYPVPEGILLARGGGGVNYVAVSLWALDATGAQVAGLRLEAGRPVLSGRGAVPPSPMPPWTPRPGAY